MTANRLQSCARLLTALLACVIVLSPATPQNRAQAAPDESQMLIIKVKSAFLLNFLKYTEWPDSAFEDESSDIVVLVLGEDPLGQTLDKTMAQGRQNGRTIRVTRQAMPERKSYRSDDAYRDALEETGRAVLASHLVYYTGDNTDNHEWLAETVGQGSTLTVGEGRDATDDGLMFGFVVEKQKLRFRAGFDAIDNANLEVNPRLLGLAQNKP